MGNWVKDKNVLITGGTSGLGKALADKFLKSGSKVFVVGRNESGLIDHENCTYFFYDFAKLDEVQLLAKKISKDSIRIDILVCNAGILSPMDFQVTADGFERSFQVNFLSHVLLAKLLSGNSQSKPNVIVNMSSPIYWKGQLDIDKICNSDKYWGFQAYANTKLFMALLSEKLADEGLQSFSFNPGTFSSGIYRHQKKWFRILYKIAAPFMTSADRVASDLFLLLLSAEWENGKMMNKKGQSQTLRYFD